MRTLLTAVLAVILPILATLSIISDRKPIFWLAIAAMVALALIMKRPVAWWLGSLFFGLFGVSHLAALLYLPPHASSSTALKTFAPGYFVMAAIFYVRHRWSTKGRI